MGRVASAQAIGTTIEWYDFFIYGTAAALVFNKVFFPEMTPLIGVMLAMVTYGVGFLARPVGAVLFGHFGDRVGRKIALIVTLLMMGLATTAIGLIPSYASIGVWAPLLLGFLRLVQGVAAGGEWGGAALIGIEHVDARRKTLFGSFAQVGSPLALLLATGVFLGLQQLPPEAFETWGWRVPFLFSAVLLPVGFFIRRRIHESPDFEAVSRDKQVSRVPVVELLAKHWRAVLIGTGSFAGVFATYYVFTSFVLAYATSTLGLSASVALPGNLIAAATEAVFIFIGVAAAVRYSARKVAVVGAVGLVVWAFPGFMLVHTKEAGLLYLAIIVSMAFVGITYGVLAAEVVQLFVARVRYTGASLSYHLAAVIGGGIMPSLSTWLADKTSSVWPVAAATAVIAVAMVLSCLLLPKQTPEGESAELVEVGEGRA
ncbi:MAG: MFS transporter [Streptosporangiales bacterium]|nr:MFS transporter [Streptosporangiales bacterium]